MFVVVPKISFPIFIPDINNSFFVSLGLFTCTSYKAEEIAIDVSIILPISPIITMEMPRFIIFKPVS